MHVRNSSLKPLIKCPLSFSVWTFSCSPQPSFFIAHTQTSCWICTSQFSLSGGSSFSLMKPTTVILKAKLMWFEPWIAAVMIQREQQPLTVRLFIYRDAVSVKPESTASMDRSSTKSQFCILSCHYWISVLFLHIIGLNAYSDKFQCKSSFTQSLALLICSVRHATKCAFTKLTLKLLLLWDTLCQRFGVENCTEVKVGM